MNAYQNEVWNWRRNCAGYAEMHQREYDALGNRSTRYAAECKLLADTHKAMLNLWLALPDEVQVVGSVTRMDAALETISVFDFDEDAS